MRKVKEAGKQHIDNEGKICAILFRKLLPIGAKIQAHKNFMKQQPSLNQHAQHDNSFLRNNISQPQSVGIPTGTQRFSQTNRGNYHSLDALQTTSYSHENYQNYDEFSNQTNNSSQLHQRNYYEREDQILHAIEKLSQNFEEKNFHLEQKHAQTENTVSALLSKWTEKSGVNQRGRKENGGNKRSKNRKQASQSRGINRRKK